MVKEARGAAFEFLGQYWCTVISLKNSHWQRVQVPGGQVADRIVPGRRGRRITRRNLFIFCFFGIVLYNRWFVKPAVYEEHNTKGDRFGAGKRVFLNQVQLKFALKKSETKHGEETPLDLVIAFNARMVDVYQCLYIAPEDVVAMVIEKMIGISRGFIGAHNYQEIQEIKSNGGRIVLGADAMQTINTMIRDWGIEVMIDSILILDVGLQDEDQKARAAKVRQQLLAAATASEVLGAMLENEALSMGLADASAARAALQTTEEGKRRLTAITDRANQVVTQKTLGARLNLFGNADGTSLDSVAATIASLITLATGGNGDNSSDPSSGSDPANRAERDRSAQNPGPRSPEEIRRDYEERRGRRNR